MPPVLRSNKRKRSTSSAEDTAEHQVSRKRPTLPATPTTTRRSIGERQRDRRPALTARSLERIPHERANDRVCRWEGRDTTRLRNMSSSTTASNPRKRSRKTSTVASESSLPTSMSSERKSTHDKFASDVLMDNNIYGPSYCEDPRNVVELRAALERDRRSLSPKEYPDDKFQQFVRANHKALNESQLVSEVVHPYFTSYFEKQTSSTDLAFTNLEPIVRPPAKMPHSKPDHSFGEAKGGIDPAVRHALDRYIVCAPGPHTPVAVNDMMQVKGRDGKASVLESQITLDGAVGERAMHALHSYANGSTYSSDGKAYAFVQSYHAGTMKFHAAHRQPSATGGPDRIYTTEIAGQYLCGSPAQLRDGLKKFRNSVEYAAECRRQAVNAANARAHEIASAEERGGDEEGNVAD
ncbi:hypothetical protein AC578_10561 [Pseudocercospora eumusae]|uniref:Uncharacterized protein n=1 Tax=Pseudocercospora eumusae TaxID=321146 RepID=A0A139H5L5_9PEZI|nr:hypothetical protein AC578_10561 [Pseudocercospora eumusae]